jgi:hypothetical protein
MPASRSRVQSAIRHGHASWIKRVSAATSPGTVVASRRYNERMPGRDDVRAAGPGVKLTYDDFLLFPDDGQRHELIDGRRLLEFRRSRARPALSVARTRSRSAGTGTRRGVPELVAEIASKSTRRRDETIKRSLYERTGVSEYWVVDPKRDLVRV